MQPHTKLKVNASLIFQVVLTTCTDGQTGLTTGNRSTFKGSKQRDNFTSCVYKPSSRTWRSRDGQAFRFEPSFPGWNGYLLTCTCVFNFSGWKLYILHIQLEHIHTYYVLQCILTCQGPSPSFERFWSTATCCSSFPAQREIIWQN